jgi:hypothetical protein
MLEGTPQRRRNRARPGGDLHHTALWIVPYHHPASIARQPLRRFRGNARAVLDHGLPARVRICQHGRIDMDDDLISLARRPGIEFMIQRRLRDQPQRRAPRERPTEPE